MSRPGQGDFPALLLVLLCVAGVAAMLFSTAAPPALGDYAEWTYHGVLLRDAVRGHAHPAYLLKHYPVPNALTTWALGVLMMVLPWKIAAKCWLVLEALVGVFCAYALHTARSERRPTARDVGQGWRLLLLPAAVLFGITFWAGFTNFMFGTYFAMLMAAMLLRGAESRWIYGALLVLLFFSHMIPFAFALLMLVLFAVEWRRLELLRQAVPSLLLCLWYFVGRLLHGNADGHAGMVASVPYFSGTFWLFKVNTVLKCWGFVNPALGETDSIALAMLGGRVFALLFALDVLLAVTVLGMMLRSWIRSVGEWRGDGFFWMTVGLFAGAACLMPGAAAGISDPGGRMMQVALWCGMLVATARARWTGMTVALCAVVLAAADGVLLGGVAMHPPVEGTRAGPLPARLRQFGHVYYADRWDYYGAIERGEMDEEIYPTALFLKRAAAGR